MLRVAARAPVRGPSLTNVRAALLYADEIAVSGRWFVTPLTSTEEERRLLHEHIASVKADVDMLQEKGLVTVRPDSGDIIKHLLHERAAAEALGEKYSVDWPRIFETMFVPAGCVPLWGDDAPKRLVPLPAQPGELLSRADFDAEAHKRIAQRWLSSARVADVSELALAGRVLAELPAFPHADITDILDVRERLSDARTRFRAVMAAAGRELGDVPAREFAATVDAYRREHVDEAVLNIREQLEELHVVPTLLRALRERWAVPALASLTVATAMLDLAAAAATAGSSAVIAVAAREALERRQLKRQARQQPFWYLHEVNRSLQKSASA